MAQENTRDSILDAAEELMAKRGYANTSMRQITGKAKANLAAVNYHFGSKEGMVAAMLDRRLEPLNRKRMEMLEAEMEKARQEGRRPDIEMLLRALFEPILRFFRSSEGGGNFIKIFGQIHSDSDDTIRKHFLRHMIPVFIAFFEAFQQALPALPPEKLAARIFFCIGAMAHAANILVNEKIATISFQLKVPMMPDPEGLMEELIQFNVRGMEMS